MTTVLIVDDQAENRDVLHAMLEHRGYRLLEAESGQEGLEIARKEAPDLIITDVLMPQMDGYEFVRQLRGDPAIAQTTVIFYTASYIEAESRKLARACGVIYLIVKPAEPEEVFKRIDAALGRQEPLPIPALAEDFEREHLHLLTDKLAEKVDELERVNRELQCEIAEREKADAEKRASEQRYRKLFEYAPDGILIANPEGYYLDANVSMCRMLGYSREELIGLSALDIAIPEEFPHIAPALSTIKSKLDYYREWQFRRKDGSVFPVEVIATLMPDGNVLAMFRDITERKRGEEALRTSEERMQAVIEHMTEGLVMSRLDGELIHWNRAALEMHGFTTSEEWRRWLPEFAAIFEISTLEGAVLQFEQWPMPRLFRGEKYRDLEVRLRRIGTDWERIFRYNGAIVREPSGEPLAFITITDITARKLAEQEIRRLNAGLERRVEERTAELAEANKELEAFSFSVSHDLRAPLRAIDGFSRMVIEDFAGQLPEEGRAHLEEVRRSAKEMARLIDDLLAFSRMSRCSLARETVEPEPLVRRVMADLCRGQESRQIDWRVGHLPSCEGDPAMLKQVFVNLLSNAIKFTGHRDRAVIEIGCEQKGEEPIYFVKDNGAGFDMRHVGKIFGVFQRLHGADEYEGSGVGLAIVQRVIHRHGGRVWAEGKPDFGATFYFTLPERTNEAGE